MANEIEFTDIDVLLYVPATSRYIDSKVIKYSENNLLTFTTYKRVAITPSPEDKFWVITKGYEYRPDLAAYELYGVPDFWWKLMEINSIMDITEFKAGRNIRVPQNIFY